MKRTLITVTALLALSACGTEEPAPLDPVAAPTTAASTTTTAAAEQPPAPDLYEISPAGVTTGVALPPTVTEPKAADCAEIRTVMDTFSLTTAEEVLDLLQVTQDDVSGNVTVEDNPDSWALSTPQEQADVVATVNAAVAGEC